MQNELQKAVKAGTISRKTACRAAIKICDKVLYIALLMDCSLRFTNYLIENDDDFIDNFDGTEISKL